ncbi:hypothetical protein [Pedobacter frigiditerrae]|uniref:hypothetical protein n=1 Tax=Pedobacter frigiditerrae TaxID=2530452 RepID=UPI002931A2DD|nr:hypothetical protein [Pedobacter frigiditerrae]
MKTKFENIVASCQIRFNRGEASTWKHSDFLDLSREILRDTKVSISANTLKRIFGKISVYQYYIPQQATIQALEKYGQNLQPNIINEPSEEPIASTTQQPNKSTQSRLNRYKIPIAIIVFATLVVLIFIFFIKNDETKSELKFVGKEGNLPATAFFEYTVPESEDSLFLNFGDKTKWQYVTAGKAHSAHAYLYPGLFTISLQSRKNTLQSTQVYIPSNKWIGLGYRQGEELPNNYYEFLARKTGKDSLFHLSNVQLKTKGIDTSGLVYTRLCNFTPIDIEIQNFIFEAKFKNVLDKNGLYCKSAQFQITGNNKNIRFRITTPGCSNRITNLLSEQSFVGSRVNLSKFAMDLSNWTTIKMINHNKKVSLYVNNKLLYAGNYQEPIGPIKGIFLEFEGTAFVKSCSLKTEDGKILYNF